MSKRNQEIGVLGETIARDYLLAKGYTIIGQNFHTRYGEIDIIASPNSTRNTGEINLVFVEVKTRTGRRFGYPEQSITPRKMEHLINVITEYLQKNNQLDIPWQVDVLSIELKGGKKPTITHYENITTFPEVI